MRCGPLGFDVCTLVLACIGVAIVLFTLSGLLHIVLQHDHTLLVLVAIPDLVSLCCLDANVLMLDEPTGHLVVSSMLGLVHWFESLFAKDCRMLGLAA